VIEYLVDGGPIMVPIGISSVVAVATFLERSWALRRQRVIPRGHLVQLLELARQGRFSDALALCKGRDAAVSRILEVALEERGRSRPVIKERLEEVGRREAAELERFIPILGTIGAIGPLLGLLGTVGGMILTFQAVQIAGGGTISVLAGGISQALITTFAGIAIAIPAVVANRFLLAKVDVLLTDLEDASIVMLELVAGEAGQRAAPNGEGA
jgi:biopolymer transport protein ExbB